MSGGWHLVWIGAVAALALDVVLAVLKKFGLALPGIGGA